MQEFRRVEADETHESDSRKPSGAADPSGEAFRVAAFARGGPGSSGPPGARPGLQWRLLRVGWRMQPHEQHDPKPDPPKPKEPDPRDKIAKWLLFVIAVLLGLIASQIAKRLI